MHFVMITFDNGFSISRQMSPVLSAGGCLFMSTVRVGAICAGACTDDAALGAAAALPAG